MGRQKQKCRQLCYRAVCFVTRVAEDIFGEVKVADDRILPLVVSMVANVPRLVEITHSLLKANFEPKFLLDKILDKVSERYGTTDFPTTGKYLKALIFSTEVVLDETAMDLVKDSIYTNSILQFQRSPRIALRHFKLYRKGQSFFNSRSE
jgi:hypothetical protein